MDVCVRVYCSQSRTCGWNNWNHSLTSTEARLCQLPWSESNQEKKHSPFPLIPSSSQDPRTCSEPCVESLSLISPLFLHGPACKSPFSAESFMGVRANCHLGQTFLTPNRPPALPPSPPPQAYFHYSLSLFTHIYMKTDRCMVVSKVSICYFSSKNKQTEGSIHCIHTRHAFGVKCKLQLSSLFFFFVSYCCKDVTLLQ